MIDELVIKREVDCFPDCEIIVGLQDFLETVPQRSVTGENPGPAGGKEVPMNTRKVVQDSGQADRVVCPIPRFAFDTQPERGGSVHVAKYPGFVVAIAPA